jgi:hypothetical protein
MKYSDNSFCIKLRSLKLTWFNLAMCVGLQYCSKNTPTSHSWLIFTKYNKLLYMIADISKPIVINLDNLVMSTN